MDRGDRAAHAGGREPGQDRAAAVAGLSRRRLGHHGPYPRRPDAVDQRRGVPFRKVDQDVAGPVQPAGAVVLHLAFGPAGPGERLPAQRRVVGDHPDALDLAVGPQQDQAARRRSGQPGVEPVAGPRLRGEAGDPLARPGPAARPARVDGRAEVGQVARLVAHGRGGAQFGQRHRHDLQVGERAEGDLLLAGQPARGDLRSRGHRDRLGPRRGQPEGQVGPGRGRRAQRDPEQVEELAVVPLRHLVEPVAELVGDGGDRLDQGHPRIVDVVVGPGRDAALDEALGVIHEILESPVVEVGRGERHRVTPRGSSRTGRPGCAGRWWP